MSRYCPPGQVSPISDLYGLTGHSRAPGASYYLPTFDKWDVPYVEGTTSVYLLHGCTEFDTKPRVLYVGISDVPAYRWSQHRKQKPWWDCVHIIERRLCPTRDVAFVHEAELIEALDPPFNSTGSRGHQRRVNRPKVLRALDRVARLWSVPE